VRIALLTYSTRPRGGVVHTLALAEALAALGEIVDVWSLARGGDAGFFRPVDSSVALRLVPFADVEGESVGQRITRSIDTLAEAFDPGEYEIVHAQDCISANAVPNCIRTVHHLDTFTTPELVACHERAIVRPYAHVCVSASVAREVEAGWGLRATVIPNGVDAERFAAASGEDDVARAERRRWTDQLGAYVLAVGGIEPRKGTTDLIEAMAAVRAARPELKLVIAGGETLFDYREYRESALRRAAELGVQPIMLGPVEHDRLPALMAAAEVFAFPSVKEGFGLAAMEALAGGTPAVMRDLPVLREVFGPAVSFAGSISTLATTILELAGSRDRHRVEVGRDLAFAHSWARAAREHVAFYRTFSVPVTRTAAGMRY
jgi:glycosyltransferase-like protein